MKERRGTVTSNFGAGARENHDASPFYKRFRAPELSNDDHVPPSQPVAEPCLHGDARNMDKVADGSVALVVTSPPYFAGKQYEEELERDGIPASYLEYLELLRDVFAECVRKLEPGGRIAVNVANLGRKPYRSLSADIIRIFEDDLGLLLRGELVWQKGEGANGSCAWGSFRSASNPVLRDITERVIVASKGRFDRARSVKQREKEGLPHRNTLATDDFMALTLDVWDIPPESARRVGHPAPFPVELPEKLISLYTFEDDLVLDPFMGSGSSMVAAARLGRRYVGYDLDESYVQIAQQRLADLHDEVVAAEQIGADAALPDAALPDAAFADAGFADAPSPDGKAATKLAEEMLVEAGFTIADRNKKIRKTGASVSFVATDRSGGEWWFDVAGSATTHRGGLLRNDTMWKWLGRAFALREARGTVPLVVLTSHLPRAGSEGDVALRAAGSAAFFDAIELMSAAGRARLRSYAQGNYDGPLAGFWGAAGRGG